MMGSGTLALSVIYASLTIMGAAALRFFGLAAEHDDEPPLRIYYAVCGVLVALAVLLMVADLRSVGTAMDTLMQQP